MIRRITFVIVSLLDSALLDRRRTYRSHSFCPMLVLSVQIHNVPLKPLQALLRIAPYICQE
jgi:hypothetical protein